MTVHVRGNATAEELAAVLAVIASTEVGDAPDGYTRWRASRLAAVRRSTDLRDAAGCATIVR